MAEKIILDNRTDRPITDLFPHLKAIFDMGKISGSGDKKQHCYITTFRDNIYISVFKNEKSERFVILESENELKTENSNGNQ